MRRVRKIREVRSSKLVLIIRSLRLDLVPGHYKAEYPSKWRVLSIRPNEPGIYIHEMQRLEQAATRRSGVDLIRD